MDFLHKINDLRENKYYSAVFVFFIAAIMAAYLYGIHNIGIFVFSVETVPLALKLLAMYAGMGVIAFLMYKKPSNIGLVLLGYVFLFFVFSLRCPADLFSTYLWAEDGLVLCSDAIEKGIAGVLGASVQGTLWFAPRFLAVISYYICLFFKCFPLYPIIMGIISRLVETAAVYYLVSDRFDWVISGREKRFVTCGMILLLVPQNSEDLVACDTSLPFALLFFMFLVGVNCFARPEDYEPTWIETVLLLVIALSSAAAPFAIAVIGWGFLRKCYDMKKEDSFDTKELGIFAAKCAVVLVGVAAQVFTIFSSGRASGVSLSLAQRLIANIKGFVFLPYLYRIDAWKFFLVGLVFWIVLAFATKIPGRVLLFCAAFSFFFILYCSMSMEVEGFYDPWYGIPGRFAWLAVEISVFLLGVALSSAVKKESTEIWGGILVLVVLAAVSIPTYTITPPNPAVANTYRLNSDAFDAKGSDTLVINIGPGIPYAFSFPVEIDEEEAAEDLEIKIATVNGEEKNSDSISKDAVTEPGGFTGKLSVPGKSEIEEVYIYENDRFLGAYDIDTATVDGWKSVAFIYGKKFIKVDDTLDFVVQTEDGAFHKGSVVVQS